MNDPIGLSRPRLNRKRAWRDWRVSLDEKILVFDRRDSGNYQVALDQLHTVEDARIRVEEVIAQKAWADQHVIDALRRALKELRSLDVPYIEVSRR